MKFKKADKRNPYMGLNNKICENPVYWCRMHQVWLSEDDVKRRNCMKRQTFDMMGTYQCSCLSKRN